jgi:hypothetical protein
VDERVNLVQKKRLAKGHQKGSGIKVNALQGGCTRNGKKLTCASQRQSMWWEALVRASI